jgi:hypothetical protein
MGGLFLSQCLLVQASDTLRRDCRNAKPRPANPSSIIAQVEGSGTLVATSESTTNVVAVEFRCLPDGRYVSPHPLIPLWSCGKVTPSTARKLVRRYFFASSSGDCTMSVLTTTHVAHDVDHHSWIWPAAKVGLALVAMIFLSLSVLAVEAKLGVASPDTSWTLAGE